MSKLFNCVTCNKEATGYPGKKYCAQSCMGKAYSTQYRKARLCKCGCKQEVRDINKLANQAHYLPGHYKRVVTYSPRGKENKNYRGGWINSQGYHCQTVYENDIAKTKLTHRIVMEQKLGRKLLKGEVVDHRDNHKLNNAPSNLRLCASNRQNTHYYWGITTDDEQTVLERLRSGMSYRKCIEGTNIKSIATVNRMKKVYEL